MAANPTWDFNKYHGAEHDEVEWCKNACCQPVPDAPSAESRTTAWVCVRNGDEAWLVGDGVNCGVSLRPLPSQEELGHIALEAWGNAHRAKTILETKATVGRAIYRALGVSE
jgi:hypothetical protein